MVTIISAGIFFRINRYWLVRIGVKEHWIARAWVATELAFESLALFYQGFSSILLNALVPSLLALVPFSLCHGVTMAHAMMRL